MLFECLVIFAYLNFDTHFSFLLMPKGERNGIKSRTHMSNQFNFKISKNSKPRGRIYVSGRQGKSVCVFLDFRSCHHQKGEDFVVFQLMTWY